MTKDELERKYRVYGFIPELIARDAKSVLITQTYFDLPDKPGIESRIRCKQTHCGGVLAKTFSYTEKESTPDVGVRHERECPISISRYHRLLRVKPSWTLEKTRYSFFCDGYLYEVDVYGGALAGLVILEIEFMTKAAMMTFVQPIGFSVREVTHDTQYSNRVLAECGMPYA